MKRIYKYIILFIIILYTVCIRIYNISYESADFLVYLNKWFNELKESGGIFALKLEIGDYTVPYMQILAVLTYLPINPLYSIKLISMIFDYLLAICVFVFSKRLTENKMWRMISFIIIIFLPTVWINSSVWGQCDSIYATFIILSLMNLINNKNINAFIFLGIAFSFKLQTIFILPIYILYYISERKFSILYFFIIPIMCFILSLPSILLGKPILDVFKVYILQTNEYSDRISLSFPGIYNILFDFDEYGIIENAKFIGRIGICVTAGIFFVFALIVFLKEIKFSKELIIKFSCWSIIVCTYFLPKMHERYMYVADIISVICILIDFRKVYLALRSKYSFFVWVFYI